jgi:hypothetical protein
MYRVPSSRRRVAFRTLKFCLATLLALPALVYNGMTIQYCVEEMVNAKRYGRMELVVAGISALAIFWTLIFVSAVVKSWPGWRALLLCACLAVLDLASIAWWVYLFVNVQ